MEKMKSFLVDTNIWLERLLDQEKTDEVKEFLETVPAEYILISDFTLHSIGVILFKLKKPALFNEFIIDLFSQGGVRMIGLNPFDQLDLVESGKKYKLDFDDAYQHNLADNYDVELVSFDQDFRRSKVTAITPKKAVKMYLEFAKG